MGNISQIKSVRNNCASEVIFVNTETSGDNRTIPSGQTLPVGRDGDGAWVPWCENSQEFAIHHIQITAPGRVYYIYQEGPHVWGSPVGFEQDASNLGPQGNQYELEVSADFSIKLLQVGG